MGKSVITTWDDKSYRKFRKKWANKAEYDKVKEIRERFNAMDTNRQSSCPFASPEFSNKLGPEGGNDNPDNTLRRGKIGGTAWPWFWDSGWKLYSMYHEYLQNRSNLKSPITFAPVQALLSEFQQNNIAVLIHPTQDDDKPKVRLLSDREKFWESKTDARVYKKTTFLETVVAGTSVPFNGWQTRRREVDIVITGKETPKELAKLKAQKSEVKSQQVDDILKLTPVTKKEMVYEYNDCVYIPTSLYEIYIDPDARLLRGPAYEATDIIWRQVVSVDQAQAEFRNSSDPFVVKDNIDRIVSAKDSQGSYTDSEPFFKVPTDMAEEKVELIRYYNKQTDKYIIVANDVLLRDGPLPYNHKELPFSRHICYELPNQFYGAGLPAFTESIQAEDETTRNMKLDQMKIDSNPPLLINIDLFDDIDSAYEDVRPGQRISVGGLVNAENVRYLERQKVDWEYYKMKDALREDAIFATGINPMAYSVPTPGTPVRTNIMSMESSLKAAKKIFSNWADGWKDSVRQRIRISQQMLPISYVEQIDTSAKGGKKPVRKYNTMVTKGARLDAINNNGKVNLQETILGPNEEAPFDFKTVFEIDDKFLELAGDLDVQVDSDTLVPVSTAIQIQLITEAMTVLIPILSNPVMLNSPGVQQLVREYIQRNGLPEKIIEGLQQESFGNEEQRAIEQESYMMEGHKIQGIPGESDRHKFTHVMTLLGLLNKKSTIMEQVANLPPAQSQSITQFQEALKQLDELIKDEQEHLAVDSLQRTESIEKVLSQAQGQSQNAIPNPGVPGMAGQPSPMGQVPTGMSNMTNMPGVPQPIQVGQMGTNLPNQGPML